MQNDVFIFHSEVDVFIAAGRIRKKVKQNVFPVQCTSSSFWILDISIYPHKNTFIQVQEEVFFFLGFSGANNWCC